MNSTLLRSNIWKKLETIFFPYLCVLCLKSSDTTRDLCLDCDASLPRLKMSCRQCGNKLTSIQEQISFICGHCLKDPPVYDFILPLFEYMTPIDQFIHQLKFKKKLMYARLLGELMAETLSNYYTKQTLPECIIPVPLHPKRLRERGFNQSLELARPISKKLGIPIKPRSYKRIRNTLQQSNVPIDQRKKNVKGAFIKDSNEIYRRVAIIDDVVTTGFTVDSLSKILKSEGVTEITVWCCARTCR